MRRGTVLNFNRNKIVRFLIQNRTLIVLMIFFVLGILISSILHNGNQFFLGLSKSIFSFYSNQHFDLGFMSVFFNSLIFNLLALCIYFIFGTSMLGVVLLPISNFIYGMFFGCLSSQLCQEYSLAGVAFNAVVLIPGTLMAVVALIFGAKESVLFSFSVSKMTFSKSTINDLPMKFRDICIKYIFLIIAVAISSLLDAAFTCSLSNIFNF